MGRSALLAAPRLLAHICSKAYTGCLRSAWWRFRLPFIALAAVAVVYALLSLGVAPTPISARFWTNQLVICRNDGGLCVSLHSPVLFDRMTITKADSIRVPIGDGDRMLRIGAEGRRPITVVAEAPPVTAELSFGPLVGAQTDAWLTSNDTVAIIPQPEGMSAYLTLSNESGRTKALFSQSSESAHCRLRGTADPVQLRLKGSIYDSLLGVLVFGPETIPLQCVPGRSVDLVVYGQIETECASVGDRVLLQVTPSTSFQIHSWKSATLYADVDSGQLVLHSTVRQQPYQMVRPSSLRIVGNLQALVTMSGETEVSVKTSGMAKSVVWSGGNIIGSHSAQVVSAGTQLLPRRIEEQRDIALSVSAIAFLVVNLLNFFWKVFKKDEH